MTLSELNACNAADFVKLLGGTWEHSPWIAEQTAASRPFDTIAALQDAMWHHVTLAADEKKLALIQAHPDLAGKLARARLLTVESTSEQASAGLDVLTPAELAAFENLNTQYRERFGFPFIICVRNHTKPEILTAFERRIIHHRDVEIQEALEQIRRIANWRIQDLIES